MSHVPPASTLTNISSKQCIYVCFLKHRLVPYTILTGFRLLRSLWKLLWATILYIYWKRNSRIKCQLHCTRRTTCVPARVPNAKATRHVQDFHYITRRKHWPSPSPLAFTSTFAASPFEYPTFIRTKQVTGCPDGEWRPKDLDEASTDSLNTDCYLQYT
jgi:hypothetical protein